MRNLYEILDIGSSAIKEEIKQAYKKLAQNNHPDKNGDVDKFKEIKLAYEILIDPDRRVEYDRSGTTEKNISIQVKAQAQLLNLFKQVIENFNPYDDIVSKLSNAVDSEQANIVLQIAAIDAKINALNKNKARVSKADGVNLWAGLIEQQIEHAERKKSDMMQGTEIANEVKKMLLEYSCSVKERPIPRGAYITTTTTNGSWA